jgi:hypothetical protein
VEKSGTARGATDDDKIQCICFVCWITKSADTHSKYVILIGVPLQKSLCEHTSMLCHIYTVCLVGFTLFSSQLIYLTYLVGRYN